MVAARTSPGLGEPVERRRAPGVRVSGPHFAHELTPTHFILDNAEHIQDEVNNETGGIALVSPPSDQVRSEPEEWSVGLATGYGIT